MRRHTKPIPLPTTPHINTPANMPSGIGMSNHFTSRPEVYAPRDTNAMWPKENCPAYPASSAQLAATMA